MKTFRFLASALLGLALLSTLQTTGASNLPKVTGGKYYSRAECVNIARQVVGEPNGIKSLTGIELGNLWYMLDNCNFLYFSDQKTSSMSPSRDQDDVEVSLDWATHEYIGRLEGAISRLPDDEKNRVLKDLGKTQPASKGGRHGSRSSNRQVVGSGCAY